MGVTKRRTSKEYNNDIVRNEAIRRESHRCGIIKAINSALDKEKPIDIIHAIDIAILELNEPQHDATKKLLLKFRSYYKE